MRCDTAKDLFSDYLEGRMERPLGLMFEHHLEECGDCKSDYADFKSIWATLDNMPEVAPPLSFRSRLMARVERECASRRPRQDWSINWGGILSTRIPARAFAAAFVLLLFVALTLQMGQQQDAIIGSPSGPTVQSNWLKTSNDLNRGDTGLWLSVVPVANQKPLTYRIRIQVEPNANVTDMKIYLLPVGQTNFTPSALQNAPTIHSSNQTWTETLGPGTVYLEWRSNGELFREAVFLPTHIGQTGATTSGFEAIDMTLYTALATTSEIYGTVIVADADLGEPIISAAASRRTLQETLAEIVDDIQGRAVHWEPMQENVYAITRKKK